MSRTLNLKDFEAASNEGGWRVWPDGWYRCLVDSTQYKNTKSGDGKCLHVKLLCVEQGDQFQRFQMEYLTLEHPSEQVVAIASSSLKAMLMAVGADPDVAEITDSGEMPALDGKTLMLRVYSRKTDSEYADADGYEQKIGGYKSVFEYQTEASGAEPTPATQGDLLAKPDLPPTPPPNDEVPF